MQRWRDRYQHHTVHITTGSSNRLYAFFVGSSIPTMISSSNSSNTGPYQHHTVHITTGSSNRLHDRFVGSSIPTMIISSTTSNIRSSPSVWWLNHVGMFCNKAGVPECSIIS